MDPNQTEVPQQAPATAAPVAQPPKPTRKTHKRKSNKKSKRGFTILELLIVVAIIAILVGIALPKLLTARQTSIENAGSASTRSTITALAAYQAKFGAWPATMSALGGTACATTAPSTTAACLLDDTFATSGLNNQYQMTYAVSGSDFTLNADPLASSPAKRHYYADSNLAIRYADGAAATATSTPLGQ